MKLRLPRFVTGVLMAVALAGCGNFTHDKQTAADAMDQFHDRFNAGEFEKIYDTADADLQGATTRADFLKFIASVHRKLGDYKTCESKGWATNTFNSQTRVTLHYKTKFAKGTGDEQFDYLISGTSATLRGYHITSNALIND